MRISCFFLNKNNVFSGCIDTFSNKSKYWSSIDNLINKSFESKTHSPDSIVKLAQKGLKFQIFDSSFWNHLHQTSLKFKESFTPSQWVKLLHIYKKIKIRNQDLYDIALPYLEGNLNSLTLKELSLLSLSFSYFSFCPDSLLSKIAETVYTRHQKTKLMELEVSQSNIVEQTSSSSPDSTSKWSKINCVVSYIHLLGSCAKCGFDHKGLFEVASEELVKNISSLKVTIPPNLIMKTLQSYARFGYRHEELLGILSQLMVTSRLSNQELVSVKSIFSKLNYKNDVMDNIISYRLGNLA